MTPPDYQTFQYLHTLEGGIVQDDMPYAFPFALTPDSQRLITVEMHETIKIWDLRTGFLQALPSHQPNSSSLADEVALSADGQRCYIVYDSYEYDDDGLETRIQTQDTATGEILERFQSTLSSVDELTINADETLLALGGDDIVMVTWAVVIQFMTCSLRQTAVLS